VDQNLGGAFERLVGIYRLWNKKVKNKLKMGCMFIFPVFSKELLHVATWLKLPKG
jgi:hypothetical protein